MNIAITLAYDGKNFTRDELASMAFNEAERRAQEKGREVTKLISVKPTDRPEGCEDLTAKMYVFETKEEGQ